MTSFCSFRGVPDLPCPEGSSPGNHGQSFAQIAESGGNLSAVRTQVSITVDSLCNNLFGCVLGPATVSAQTTAVFDYDGGVVRLIRVDQFICPLKAPHVSAFS